MSKNKEKYVALRDFGYNGINAKRDDVIELDAEVAEALGDDVIRKATKDDEAPKDEPEATGASDDETEADDTDDETEEMPA